jgi:PKHD-type hydroxylase
MAGHEPTHATDSFSSLLNVFTPQEMDRIEAYGDRLQAMEAGVSGEMGPARAGIRVTQTAWITPSEETSWFFLRMEQAVRHLNGLIYQFDLTGFSEPFQYTVYHATEGGHYDWHVDYGKRFPRKLSFSLQLSDPANYDGGELQTYGGNEITPAPKVRGTLIAFPSYVLHRVTPVTRGTRKTIVAWTAGPKFR